MKAHWKRRLAAVLEHVYDDEHQLALALSLVIGALVGLVIVAFILLTGRLAARMYPSEAAAWRRLLVPTVGSLIAGYLLFRYFPLARGSGIPQTKFALFVADGVIGLRTVIGKFVCCALSLASGIALGREGPSVHVGAGLASVIGRRLGLGPARVKALIPVGGSAALAAAFNTPIAGVLFSLEEIVGDLHAPVLGAVVVSSATAWMIVHLFLGDTPLFHVPGYRLVHPAELGIYAVLGLVGGVASVAFVKLLLALRARFLRFNQGRAWLHPVVGGLTVGVLGFFVPEVLGVGYDYIERVLNGDVVLRVLVLFAVLKIVATAVCYASGNAGGIFGPSLFIGAMVGGAVGAGAHAWFPAQTAEPGAYALVGMGAAFAGIVRTPLTSVIMIFELTRDYTIIVPLMISNLIAFYVSHRLQRVPIYEAIALQDGIHLPTGESRGQQGARVADAIRPVPDGLTCDVRVGDAASLAKAAGLEAWPVVDRDGFNGIVSSADLEAATANGMAERSLSELRTALGVTAHPTPTPHLHPDHSLSAALERMGTTGARLLPVVSRANVRQLVGLVTLADILSAFGVERQERVRTAVAPRERLVARGRLLATLGAVVTVMASLVIVDTWLARMERAETRADAARLFEEGRQLEVRGRHDEAVERFRSALSLSREERRYALALAQSLLAAGRAADGGDVVDDVLREAPTDGEANLTKARVLVALNSPADATSYYHRAIFGSWPRQASERRVAVRLELVDLLTRKGSSEDVLAELLPLQAQATEEPIQRRIASLYTAAGAPDRALEIWRRLERTHPDDAQVSAGIAEAELVRHNYRSAGTWYRAALRLAPEDARMRERLALVEGALAIDPTRRGLTSADRYARSVRLAELASQSVARCPAAARLVSDPPRAAPTRPSAAERDVATDANLDFAERLWELRTSRCGHVASGTEAQLALVLSRTSQ